MPATKLKKMFSARLPSDTRNCSLTTVMIHGQHIIAVDHSNRSLKSFSPEGLCLSVVRFEKSPRRACKAPGGEIIVTLQGAYMIAFIIKIGQELFPSFNIPTSKDYALIEGINENLLVCGKCGNPGCIDVLDYRGQVLYTFSRFSDLNGLSVLFPSYLAILPFGDILLSEVRDDGYQALIRSSITGKIQFFYQGSGDNLLKCPSGVSVDRNGYIYVACRFKHRIYCLSSTGEMHSILLTKKNEIMNPGSIFVTPDGSLLLLTEFGSEMIKMFELPITQETDEKLENCI